MKELEENKAYALENLNEAQLIELATQLQNAQPYWILNNSVENHIKWFKQNRDTRLLSFIPVFMFWGFVDRDKVDNRKVIDATSLFCKEPYKKNDFIKHSIGDKVWSIQGNVVQELEVSSIEYKEFYSNDDKHIFVNLNYGLGFDYVDDFKDVLYKNVKPKEVFCTKEELLNNIK